MRAVSRVCALGCVVAAVAAARPAAASMTLVLHDSSGETCTFQHDGSRVRIPNPSGKDDGEVWLVDLNTSLNVVVYEDAKAYFDLNKEMAAVRALVERDRKARPRFWRRAGRGGLSYRALGETRTVNGISCAMYEQLNGGRVDAQICFAPWGGAVGTKDDFAWFDAFTERAMGDIAGDLVRQMRSPDTRPGFPLWESSIEHDGSKTVAETQISRDPLPAAMFQVPVDYKQFSRRLTASEHPHIAAPRPEDVQLQGPARSPGLHLSGLVVILLGGVLLFALFVEAIILHLAANIVLDHPRFTQALVACFINTGAVIAFELIPLPPLLNLGFGAFGTFAGLKISYGASIGRTIGLFLVSALISLTLGFLCKALLHVA